MRKAVPHGPRVLNMGDNKFTPQMERRFHKMVIAIRTGYFRPERTFQSSSFGEIKVAKQQIVKIDGLYRLQGLINDEFYEINNMDAYIDR
jgi:hypothetical protein